VTLLQTFVFSEPPPCAQKKEGEVKVNYVRSETRRQYNSFHESEPLSGPPNEIGATINYYIQLYGYSQVYLVYTVFHVNKDKSLAAVEWEKRRNGEVLQRDSWCDDDSRDLWVDLPPTPSNRRYVVRLELFLDPLQHRQIGRPSETEVFRRYQPT
jgi:hypothetical protein